MKRLFEILAVISLVAAPAIAQAPINRLVFRGQPEPLPPGQVSLRVFGTAGTSTCTYYVDALYPQGETAPAGPAKTTACPGTLSSSNFVRVTWLPQAGALSYNVFKTSSAPATGSILLGNATSNFEDDKGQSLTTWTKPSRYPTPYVQIEPVGGGLRLPVIDTGNGGQKFNVRGYGAAGLPGVDYTSALNSALNAAAMQGGTVLVPPGYYLFTSPLVVPTGVTIQQERNSFLTCGITSGTGDCLQFEDSSGWNCDGSLGGTSHAHGCTLNTTANVSAANLVEFGPTLGQFYTGSGFTIDTTTATSTTAFSNSAILVSGGGQPSIISNIQATILQGAAYPGLLVEIGYPQTGMRLFNVEVNGGAPPCEFTGNGSTSRIEDVRVWGITCEHATNATSGAANHPQILIDGQNATGGIASLQLAAVSTEGLSTDTTTQPMMIIRDATDVQIDGYQSRPMAAGSTSYAVELDQTTPSSAKEKFINLHDIYSSVSRAIDNEVAAAVEQIQNYAVNNYTFANPHDTGSHGDLGIFDALQFAIQKTQITSGSGAPSGACQSGSIYLNSSGGSGTTLYACVSSAWADVK